jgi:aspartyl-tRNA(Asn)/glutamyl-tRNA(Gln) amidotransferase subunit A
VDLVLTPTLPIVPPPLGRGVAPGDLDVREALIRFTYPFSSLGWPALALPCGEADGLPVSLQLAGRAGADALVLGTGRLLGPVH